MSYDGTGFKPLLRDPCDRCAESFCGVVSGGAENPGGCRVGGRCSAPLEVRPVMSLLAASLQPSPNDSPSLLPLKDSALSQRFSVNGIMN